MTLRLVLACTLVAGALRVAFGANQFAGPAGWVNIPDPVTTAVTRAGTPIPWPGYTAGMAVDRTTGT